MIEEEYCFEHFIEAQKKYYKLALDELRSGHKESHWIWFIFPQIEGLGKSEISRRFAITDLQEAHAYLKHPILGVRLCECVQTILDISGRNIAEILGQPDDMKFLSSLTLFNEVVLSDNKSHIVFAQAIAKYFHGIKDQRTLELL